MSLETYLGLAAARRNLSGGVRKGAKVSAAMRESWKRQGQLIDL